VKAPLWAVVSAIEGEALSFPSWPKEAVVISCAAWERLSSAAMYGVGNRVKVMKVEEEV
jgi:hypothetical protein